MKTFYFNLAVSVLLIIEGFFVPPAGIIDGSELTAVGLLLMFSVVEKNPKPSRLGNQSRSVKETSPQKWEQTLKKVNLTYPMTSPFRTFTLTGERAEGAMPYRPLALCARAMCEKASYFGTRTGSTPVVGTNNTTVFIYGKDL